MAFIGKQPGKAAITSTDITDGIITADKLASDSVTTAKIADNGVTTAKINADAVTDAKIADDVVGTEHLTAGEVDTTALGADAVTAAKIADNAISEEHLDATVITGMTELASEPADTDEFLVSDAGTLKRIDYSLIKGGGITMADQFRLTSNFTNNAQPISSNLERVDTSGQGTLGSGMTESSGIFTFPSTGIYLVEFICTHFENGLDDATMYVEIYVTTNNSSYTAVARTYGSNRESESSTTIATSLVDVTDTTNVKVRFDVDNSNSSNVVRGDSNKNETHFNFIRLGDT